MDYLESDHATSGILGWWHNIRDHERTEVNLNTSWIGVEDTDFWDWFWIWYFEYDKLWTFDHPASEMQANSWLWFQDVTRGSNETMDAIIIDFDDSEQWSWQEWDNFWDQYLKSENTPESLTSFYLPVDGDEDKVCESGFFVSDGNLCLRCPSGC